MKSEDLASLGIVLSFFVLLGIEAFFPARSYPARKAWRLRGVVQLLLIGGLASVVPLLLPVSWLDAHRLLDGRGLGVLGGAALGYLVVSCVAYAWHRSTHRFAFLWRSFHQIHHAPQRLDMAGATVFHPLDIAMYIVLSTLVTTLLLGLSPEAAALTGFIAQFYAYFQHMNVKTPRWLGYLIQRPEAHFVHHQRGVHGFNYGDLPIWDLLFGTFKNPAEFGVGGVGFDAPADARYGAMLLLRDVSSSVGTQAPRALEASVAEQQRPPAALAREA